MKTVSRTGGNIGETRIRRLSGDLKRRADDGEEDGGVRKRREKNANKKIPQKGKSSTCKEDLGSKNLVAMN